MRRIRRAQLIVSVLAGLATLTVTSLAAGQVPAKKPTQDTVKKAAKAPTSAQRIKIVKDAKGEVELQAAAKPVLDDATLARLADEARLGRERAAEAARLEQRYRDSVQMSKIQAQYALQLAESRRLAAEAEARVRLELAREQEALEQARQLAIRRRTMRGVYIGVAGGASMPQRAVRDGYTGGWNTTIPVGWDAMSLPFGVRADFSVDHLNGTRFRNQQNVTTSASGDVTVWSLNLGAKARMHVLGTTNRTHLYAIGGLGAHRVAEGVYGAAGPNAGKNMSFSDAKTRLGWNAGAGASIGFGGNELFIESRFVQVKTDLEYRMNGGIGTYTSFTPIVVGFSWF